MTKIMYRQFVEWLIKDKTIFFFFFLYIGLQFNWVLFLQNAVDNLHLDVSISFRITWRRNKCRCSGLCWLRGKKKKMEKKRKTGRETWTPTRWSQSSLNWSSLAFTQKRSQGDYVHAAQRFHIYTFFKLSHCACTLLFSY